MTTRATSIALFFVLALLLGGCPPDDGSDFGRTDDPGDDDDDDAATDDDDDTEPGDDDDVVPEGDCGRYAWIQSPGAVLYYDMWPEDRSASSGPDGTWCVSEGDDEYDAEQCYRCDAEGVRLATSYWRTGVECFDREYTDPPLVWRHDAAPGDSWTTDWSGVEVDCDEEGGWGTFEEQWTFEVLAEEEVTVPAGTFDTLVLRRIDDVYGGEFWEWISDGLGPVQEGVDVWINNRLIGYEL